MKIEAVVRQLGIGLLLTATTFAQFPDKYKNLQYFPKSVSKQELQAAMRDFSLSLGGGCETCHVESADHHMDFASDDKEEKRTARQMLKMVDEINHSYISKLGASPVQVQCVTCHRGIQKPQTISAVLTKTMEKKDVQAAVAQYADLRKKYYGSASYDFSELPLDLLAESLVQQGKPKDAAAIMEMNVSFNTPTARTYNVLAQVHKANGEPEKAKADLEKVLQLQPENRRAKQMLEELKGNKQ
jgi:tetratricopeptide (TPR) repeat protein